jgi:hypothetical protein
MCLHTTHIYYYVSSYYYIRVLRCGGWLWGCATT